MKAVAASRFRKAQDQILGARPFANEMERVLSGLASHVDTSAHPLLRERTADAQERRTLLVVVTADKGLCGSFNANIIKQAGGVIAGSGGHEVSLGLVGRKGRDFFGKRGFDVRFELINIFGRLEYSHAQTIARAAIETFTGGKVDSVQLVYNEFKNVLQQRVVVDQVLPITRLEAPSAGVELPADYLYEPDPAVIFNTLIPHHVEIQFYRALLESAAAEHAARLLSMDSATKNATEMIENLTLYMNKVRQATITREIIEVVSGAGTP